MTHICVTLYRKTPPNRRKLMIWGGIVGTTVLAVANRLFLMHHRLVVWMAGHKVNRFDLQTYAAHARDVGSRLSAWLCSWWPDPVAVDHRLANKEDAKTSLPLPI